MTLWADWSLQGKFVAVGAIVTAISGISAGAHFVAMNSPFVTYTNLTSILDDRKSARDKQLTDASDSVAKQIKELNDKIGDIDDRSLRWRVDDYPAKIGNAKTNLVTLQAAIETPGLSFVVKQNLDQQIADTKKQILDLTAAQAADSCTLTNLHRVVPLFCPP